MRCETVLLEQLVIGSPSSERFILIVRDFINHAQALVKVTLIYCTQPYPTAICDHAWCILFTRTPVWLLILNEFNFWISFLLRKYSTQVFPNSKLSHYPVRPLLLSSRAYIACTPQILSWPPAVWCCISVMVPATGRKCTTGKLISFHCEAAFPRVQDVKAAQVFLVKFLCKKVSK